MEIELINFRCYEKRTFYIPFGVNLIDGPSGKGKSTLLQAIKYALYGNVKQVCSYGQKKTTVKLSYEGLHITRTNIPSRIVVTVNHHTYEDDAAQEIVYKRFGNQFDITSYMVQKGSNQFFTLSGSDKLILLEELALHGEDNIQTTKNSIQQELKQVRDKLKDTQSQLLLLQQYTINPPQLKKKQSIRSLSDIQQLILFTHQIEISLRKELESYQKNISNYSTSLQKQKVEASIQETLLFEVNQMDSERKQINERLLSLQSISNKLNDLHLDEIILKHEQFISYQEMTQKVEKQKHTYDSLFEKECISYQNEIKTLEEQIIPFHEDMNQLKKQKEIAEEEYKEHQFYIQYEKTEKEWIEQDLAYKNTLEKEKEMVEQEKKRLLEQIIPCVISIQDIKSKRDDLSQLQIKSKRRAEIELEVSDIKYKDIQQKLDSTRQKIEKVNKKLTELEQKKFILSCPGCKKHLIIKSQVLCSADHQPITDSDRKIESEYKEILPKLQKQEDIQQRLLIQYESLQSELSLLPLTSNEEIQEQINECTHQIEKAQQINTTNDMLQLQLNNLSKTPIELKFNSMKETVLRTKKQLDSIPRGKEYPSSSKETIQNYLNQIQDGMRIQQSNQNIQQQLNIKQKNTPEKKFQSIKDEIEVLVKELHEMKKGEKCNSICMIQEQANELEQTKREVHHTEKRLEEISLLYEMKIKGLKPIDKTDYMTLIQDCMEMSQSITKSIDKVTIQKNEYQVYEHEVKAYLEYKKKVQDIQEKNKLCTIYQIRMEQLERLANHIIQAEGVCLEKFIQRVNHTMRWYLEQFFPDQSVTMELDSEKECKNGKVRHEICVHVMHQHHPCELKALSGGEYDRCALAFMLAINELSHSPCLFLDESISSLDMSLSEDVLEVIKEKQSELHKIVLLVSHQANTGFFDHVIRI